MRANNMQLAGQQEVLVRTSAPGLALLTSPPSAKRSRQDCARATQRTAAASQPGVTLLDYGAGNVRSVKNALKQLGQEWTEVNFFRITKLRSEKLCEIAWMGSADFWNQFSSRSRRQMIS